MGLNSVQADTVSGLNGKTGERLPRVSVRSFIFLIQPKKILLSQLSELKGTDSLGYDGQEG
jgi:hypothetical protein